MCPSNIRKFLFFIVSISFPKIVLKFKTLSLLDVTCEYQFRRSVAEVEQWHPIISSQFYLLSERFFFSLTSAEFHTSLTFFFGRMKLSVIAVTLLGKYEVQHKYFAGGRILDF